MGELDILFNLGTIIGGAFIVVLATRWLNVPNIVAYIVAGLLLGPVTGILSVTHTLELIAEFGIALLLFLVGLELSIAKIKDVGPVAVAAGLGQVVFTAAGGFGFAYLLGFDPFEALFIAIALTFSSTVVVVKLLEQKDDLDALYGRIAVGIFLVQDLVVVVALTFVAGMTETDAVETAEILSNLGVAFAGMIGLLVVALLASRYVLPSLFGWVARSPEVSFIWALCWCFLFVLAAEEMGLSVEIGAFLAGIALAQLPYNHDLRRRVNPLVNFFIAVFFVYLGLQMELGAALQYWDAALVLSLFVLIGNPLIFMIIITRMGYSERNSFLTSVTVAQISEFSFILAAMALSAGLIEESILSLIAIIGFATIGISAYMILYNEELYEFMHRWGLLRIFGASTETEEPEDAPLSNHVIVVGMNTMGRRIVNDLCQRGQTVLAIDYDAKKLEGLPCKGLQGDVSHSMVIEAARFESAQLVVSALNIEEINNLLAFKANQANVPCSIHAFDHSVRHDLKVLNTDHMLNSQQAGANRILSALQAHIKSD